MAISVLNVDGKSATEEDDSTSMVLPSLAAKSISSELRNTSCLWFSALVDRGVGHFSRADWHRLIFLMASLQSLMSELWSFKSSG